MKTSLNLKVLTGLFLVSLSTLTFELLISRVMSAVAWYHFAFMAICLALFGLAVGAVIVHTYRDVLLKRHHRVLCIASVIFSLTLLVNLMIVCFVPPFTNSTPKGWEITFHYFNIFLIFISIAVPLIGSGVCVSLVFNKYAAQANRIYFINLTGSALGCLLFIPVINFLGVVNSYFLLAFLGLLAAYFFSLDDKNYAKKTLLALSLSLALFLGVNDRAGLLELQWAKGQLDNQAFYKEWNAFSYIRLTYWGKDNSPMGWGFSPKKRNEIRRTKVEQIYLDIDAIAGTVMTNFEDRDINKISFLRYDITALPYYLIKNGDVLVVGVGSGRDILTALLFNQKSVTGVEINETILYILEKLLSEFSGNLSRHPKVEFVHNEARSYINSSDRKFDLIQLSLIDTFAATQSGAYALTENSLYTVEAFKTYWRHLNGRGVLSVSYWMHPNEPAFILKLTGATAEALKGEGVNDPRAHLVIVHKDGRDDNRGVANLLVKKQPFSGGELRAIQRYCDEMGFHLILSPAASAYDSFAKMSDVRSLKGYAKDSGLNISPATDDKPFFFLLRKFRLRSFLPDLARFKLSAEYILIWLLLTMIVLTFFFIGIPLLKITKFTHSGFPILPFSIYFASIGLAFMFIEMPLLTRLSSFLGHPIYSLSVALFSFLISSGLGSYFIGKTDNKKTIAVCMTLFIAICLLSVIFLSPVLNYFSKYPVGLRLLTAAFIVFPLGFFMGFFLPQGINLLEQRKGPVALFWGLNGAMSVIGSVLAMILQITLGLNMTFLLGGILYLGAIITWLRFNAYAFRTNS